jgi:hypothetical protein
VRSNWTGSMLSERSVTTRRFAREASRNDATVVTRSVAAIESEASRSQVAEPVHLVAAAYDLSMNREERIAWARREAAEEAPERARQKQQNAGERSQRVVSMGSTKANWMADLLSQDDSIPWLGPVSQPYEWTQAVEAAREVTIEAARHSRTETYGELRIAAYKATDMKVGHNQFAELAMSANRPGDKCLLSAIIVVFGDPRRRTSRNSGQFLAACRSLVSGDRDPT